MKTEIFTADEAGELRSHLRNAARDYEDRAGGCPSQTRRCEWEEKARRTWALHRRLAEFGLGEPIEIREVVA